MKTLLTPAEVANFLGVTIGTLSVWRCTGRYSIIITYFSFTKYNIKYFN